MPRGGKKPGNQHNSRHENGVVAPGKRIVKQKSNGHLNGSVQQSTDSSGVSIPSAAAHTTTRPPDKRNSGTASASKGGIQGAGRLEQSTLDDSIKASETLPNGIGHANGSLEHTHRKIDVNAAKNPMVHDSSVWHLALTILRSCPLGDTIAILIFLLALPPSLLTVTNALFAILTFITPTGASALPTTFHEIFQGSGGTPSLATIFLTDVIGLVLWLVMWAPVQTLCVGLAQAVVATTLGGGTASKKKGSDRTLLCMSIVTISHVARHQWLPNRILGYDWSAILSSIPYVSRSPPFFFGEDFIPTRSPGGWFRILIALHILVQGLVHVARRWYQKRDYAQTISATKRPEPEARAGSPVRPTFTTPLEGNHAATSLSSDIASKLPPSSVKEREKISAGKKKRKQGTYVRSQQPLWAAFAHTKVTVLREYEQSHNQSENVGSGATDARNLGSAPFVTEEGYVWISQVSPTSFRFDTSYLKIPMVEESDSENHNVTAWTGIDRSKPLFVRINDTDWTSTTIERIVTTEDSSEGRWTGEVFGLTPSSSYKCSFVESEDGVVLYSAIVTTPPSLAVERVDASVPLTTSPPRVHRPSSPKTPLTTLKDSILAFESGLLESQTRQKRSKKDNKTNTTALRKEIDVFNSKISKLGSEDKAHANRHLQWNQLSRQADEAVNHISDEIDSLGCLPEDDLSLYKERKTEWDEARAQQSAAREDLVRNRMSAHRERSTAQNEASTTQQKRERLTGRKSKLNDQHDKLDSVSSQGLDERERKESAKDLDRLHFEQKAQEQISGFQRSIQDGLFLRQQMLHQAQLTENAYYGQQMTNGGKMERPLTPEGDLPGTVPQQSVGTTSRFSAFGSPDHSNPLRSHSGTLQRGGYRPRSTSVRSGNSAYVDFENEDPAPPMPTRAIETIRQRGRKQSGGSGSGSGSSGSQRDPASPVIGSHTHMSPIGKRSPVWNN